MKIKKLKKLVDKMYEISVVEGRNFDVKFWNQTDCDMEGLDISKDIKPLSDNRIETTGDFHIPLVRPK